MPLQPNPSAAQADSVTQSSSLGSAPATGRLTLGLMAKFWEPGRVKTRLGRSIGMNRAAAIHQHFVSQLCASLSRSADRRIVSLSPDTRMDSFQATLESWKLAQQWDIMPQGEGLLGDRMQRWFVHTLTDPGSRSILIGADCPSLGHAELEQADRLLQDHEIVLGPAADGGYYLIGLRGSWSLQGEQFASLLSEIPWSTDQVMAITRQRIKTSQLSSAELPTKEDVDTIVELNHLRENLSPGTNADLELLKGINLILREDFQPGEWQ